MEMTQYKSLISAQHPSHWKVVRNKTFLSVTGEVVGKRANEFVLLSLTTNGVVVRDIESGKGKFPTNALWQGECQPIPKPCGCIPHG